MRAERSQLRTPSSRPPPAHREHPASSSTRAPVPQLGAAYLLWLVGHRYAPEAVAQVRNFLPDRLADARMDDGTHVADKVFVGPRSPRSYHRVLAPQAAHAGLRVTPSRDHRPLTSCADIALRLPGPPRVDTPLTRSASGAPALRLALAAATRQVLRNGLALLGVSAPERM